MFYFLLLLLRFPFFTLIFTDFPFTVSVEGAFDSYCLFVVAVLLFAGLFDVSFGRSFPSQL